MIEDAIIFDKQPQAVEIEKALLGTALMEENAAVKIIDELQPPHIYSTNHRKVFEAITDLFEQGKLIDPMTVGDYLSNKGLLTDMGGHYFLAELSSHAVTTNSQVENYILIVKQKYLQRQMIELSAQNIKAAKADEDIFEVFDISLERHGQILDGETQKSDIKIKDTTQQVYEDILSGKKAKGITTKINAIDQNLYGLRPKKLYIIAARPAMGKTARALQIACNVAEQDKAVGIISLEMDADEITRRMLANLSQTELQQIELNEVDKAKLPDVTKAADTLAQMPIHFKELASNLVRIRATAKRWKIQKNLQCLIVDYLQLMDGSKDGNREQEVSSISRGLKKLAMELEIPIICLSQLSRNVENRGGDKIPILSDLRESGAIEQDADAVMFLWRPEYYQLDEVPDSFQPTPQNTQNFLGIRIAKNRGGQIGDFSAKFFGATQNITNLRTVQQVSEPELKEDIPF